MRHDSIAHDASIYQRIQRLHNRQKHCEYDRGSNYDRLHQSSVVSKDRLLQQVTDTRVGEHDQKTDQITGRSTHHPQQPIPTQPLQLHGDAFAVRAGYVLLGRIDHHRVSVTDRVSASCPADHLEVP